MRNILNIFKNELTHNFRSAKSMSMMILLPIVFMLILGSALSKNFTPTMNKMEAIYTIQSDKEMSSTFENFIKSAKQNGLTFNKVNSEKEGFDSIKNKKNICYVKISGNPCKIEFYKNARFSFEADFAEISLSTFVQRYNALSEIKKVNPTAYYRSISNNSLDFVKVETLAGKKTPDSKSYYGLTMLTMIIFYAMYSGTFSIKREKYSRTGTRLICSPISKHEILVGKIIGGLLITILQIAIVFLFSIYIQGAYWGTHIGIIILILLSEAIAALSIGIGVSFIFKTDAAIYGILNIIPMLFSFLGGAFFSIDGFSKILVKIADISPIRWVNQSITGIVYNNDYSKVPATLAINLGIAIIFIAISSYLFKKEALQP